MSKTLFIMRHAKTEAYSESGQDFGRELTVKGFEAATRMGEHLTGRGLIPQAIQCSTAARTQQTLEAMLPFWQSAAPSVAHTDALYLASQGDILSLINALPDTQDKVMLIGHNPGFHEIVQTLSGQPLVKFSPGMVAVLEGAAANWASLAPGQMELVDLISPKNL